jgi:hypothetical protein
VIVHDWKAELRKRFTGLQLSPAREASILDELCQHLEDRREALIAGGADDETATALTLAELERADLLAPRLGTLPRPAGSRRPPPACRTSGCWPARGRTCAAPPGRCAAIRCSPGSRC